MDADEDEESRADRRHYSPLDLRRPHRRSIQGRFRANCGALKRALTSTLAERTRCTTALILCILLRHPRPVVRDDRTSRRSPVRDQETAAALVWGGELVQCANADASLMGRFFSNTSLTGREKRQWFTGLGFAFLLLPELKSWQKYFT